MMMDQTGERPLDNRERVLPLDPYHFSPELETTT
jgi:hypothetical protein